MKTASLLIAMTGVGLIACGFDSSQSDPLREGSQGNYVSSAELHTQQMSLEQKFLAETKAYQESIKKIQGDAHQNVENLNNQYQTIINGIRSEAIRNRNQCEAEKRQFVESLNSYKTEQDQVISELQTVVAGWEEQAKTCQNILENPERQNFHGLLFRRHIDTALPQALEFSSISSGQHAIMFQLDLSHEAVQGLQIEPALPNGLSLTRSSDTTWVISGTPQVGFAPNQTQKRSIHRIFPVIDYASIQDEATRSLIEQQNFEEKIMVVIYQGQVPSVEGVSTDSSNGGGPQ